MVGGSGQERWALEVDILDEHQLSVKFDWQLWLLLAF